MAVRPLVSVVDDDESVRESLPDLLKELGFEVQAFASAEEFLVSDALAHTRCLILDIAMPGMTGTDLQHELAQRHQYVPIVFITGSRDISVRPGLMAQGAVECLFKPFSEDQLAQAVNNAIKSAPVIPDTTPVVFVVDDDISVCESLELMIRNAGWKPELFTSAQAFLSRPVVSVPSCLVLDIEMPGLNGLDLQAQIASTRPEMPIIFLTGYGDIPRTVRAMKAGAAEFFTKPVDDKVLLEAIERAIERSRIACAQVAEMRALRLRHDSLTPREKEVMALVVAGLLNKQVGAKLDISEITVKAHRGRVMEKMNASSLADLVRMSERLQLR